MKEIYKDLKKVFESNASNKIVRAVAIIIVAMLIFCAGVTVGFHKASFGRDWGNHYNENFGMGRPKGGFPGMDKMGMMNGFPNAHGAIGEIIKLELPNIIVVDKDGLEKIIFTDANTKIQKGKTNIMPSDLAIDDFIVVIGAPNTQGLIEAKLIRVLPNPESLPMFDQQEFQ